MAEKKQQTAAEILAELRQKRGLGPAEDEEELKPAEEEQKKLVVSVKAADQSYRFGDTVRATVSVMDADGKALSAVPVEIQVVDPNERIQSAGQGMTNTNGVAFFGSEIILDDPAGTYTVEAEVFSAGYEPGRGSTTFEVVKPDAVAAPVEKETEEPEIAPTPVPASEPTPEPEEKGAEKDVEDIIAEMTEKVIKAIDEELRANPERFRGERGEQGTEGPVGENGLDGEPGKSVSPRWIEGAIAMALFGIIISVLSFVFRPSVDMGSVRSDAIQTFNEYLESEGGQSQITAVVRPVVSKVVDEAVKNATPLRTPLPAPTTEGTETTEKTTPAPKVETTPAAKGTDDFDALMEMIK